MYVLNLPPSVTFLVCKVNLSLRLLLLVYLLLFVSLLVLLANSSCLDRAFSIRNHPLVPFLMGNLLASSKGSQKHN